MGEPVAVAEVAPVMTPTPFGQTLAQGGIAPGNAFLANMTAMYCRQHIEVVELVTGCETKNRYSFTPIAQGTVIPSPPNASWSKEYRSAAGFNPLLKAKEESECFERVCCPLFRGFTMTFKDGNGSDFLTITDPSSVTLATVRRSVPAIHRSSALRRAAPAALPLQLPRRSLGRAVPRAAASASSRHTTRPISSCTR